MLEAPVPTPPDDDTVIAFDRVSVIRGGSFLLRSLSWQVELDERWVILGPNGAGKTTLLNLASGRMHPSRGTAWILAERLGKVDVNELRTRIGLTTGRIADQVPPNERVLDVVVHRRLVGRRPLAGELRPTGRAPGPGPARTDGHGRVAGPRVRQRCRRVNASAPRSPGR